METDSLLEPHVETRGTAGFGTNAFICMSCRQVFLMCDFRVLNDTDYKVQGFM